MWLLINFILGYIIGYIASKTQEDNTVGLCTMHTLEHCLRTG